MFVSCVISPKFIRNQMVGSSKIRNSFSAAKKLAPRLIHPFSASFLNCKHYSLLLIAPSTEPSHMTLFRGSLLRPISQILTRRVGASFWLYLFTIKQTAVTPKRDTQTPFYINTDSHTWTDKKQSERCYAHWGGLRVGNNGEVLYIIILQFVSFVLWLSQLHLHYLH